MAQAIRSTPADIQRSLVPAPLSERVEEAIRSSGYFRSSKELKEEIGALSAQAVKQLLDVVAPRVDSLAMAGSLGDLVPLEKIQDAVRTEFPQHIDALQTAKSLVHEANYYLQTTAERASPTLKARLERIFDSMIAILESILNGLGIAEFFKPADSDMHADFKAQKIMLVLSLFSMLSAVLLPAVGPALAGMIVGGIILSISALSLIYPLFRPAPAELPKAENWTQQLKQGAIFTAEGRKQSLDEIAATLIASKDSGQHVMLLGKTGVGKTETAKAFAAALQRGEYPELKGKQVMYINTADLVSNVEMFSYGNKILERLSETMGRHREKYILVLDEIHMACQEREGTFIGDQLKTFLDKGKENFPYVIGITTDEDYYRDIYVNHAAFARRFKRIAIENTDDTETMKILNNAYLKQAPKVILNSGSLDSLLRKSKAAFGADSAMPATALRTFTQCVQRTGSSQKSSLEDKVELLREKIQSLYSEGAVRQGIDLLSHQKEDDAAKLESELGALEQQLGREKEEIGRLFEDRSHLASLRKSMFEEALKAAKDGPAKDKSAFLLLSHFTLPALEARILNEATRLGIKAEIDDPLIDQVIADQIAQDQKAQEAIAKGKVELKTRQKE